MINNENGSIYLFAALILPVFIAISALVIDGCQYMYYVNKLNSAVSNAGFVIVDSINYDAYENYNILVYDKEKFEEDYQGELDYLIPGAVLKKIEYSDKTNSGKAEIEVVYEVNFILIDIFGIADVEIKREIDLYYP